MTTELDPKVEKAISVAVDKCFNDLLAQRERQLADEAITAVRKAVTKSWEQISRDVAEEAKRAVHYATSTSSKETEEGDPRSVAVKRPSLADARADAEYLAASIITAIAMISSPGLRRGISGFVLPLVPAAANLIGNRAAGRPLQPVLVPAVTGGLTLGGTQLFGKGSRNES